MKNKRPMRSIVAAALMCALVLGGCGARQQDDNSRPETGNGTVSTSSDVSNISDAPSDVSNTSDTSSVSSDTSETVSTPSSPVSEKPSGESSSVSSGEPSEDVSRSEESKAEPIPEYVPNGRYRLVKNRGNGQPYACDIELFPRDDRLYFRFIGSAGQASQYVLQSTSVALTDIQDGSPIVFRLEEHTISLQMVDAQTLDVVYDTDQMDMSGRYVYQELTQTVYSIPASVHDPKSPDGAMDAGLAEIARQTLGLDADAELTAADCEKITRFMGVPQQSSITSLDGIEYFTHLQSLELSEDYITDLSPLNRLPELESISFTNGILRTLPDLSGCQKLKKVSFVEELLEDITSLASIPHLEHVFIMNSYITSIAPLKDNHTIKYLQLDGSCISDWETIADNEDLKQALVYGYDEFLTLENRAKEILQETITDEMSDLEKQVRIAKRLEDLIEYVEIDGDDDTATDMDTEDDGGHSVYYDALIRGRGVCRDYADAAKYLMNLAGLKVLHVYSDTHSWNMIDLDGTWYEFDCTWDDKEEIGDWIWFNKSRAYMDQADDHWMVHPERYSPAKEDMPFTDYVVYGD